MPDEDKKNYPNIFVMNTIYPDVSPIFSFHLESIEKIKGTCFVVLDTNVLLAPYIIGKEDLLTQCRKTYGSLAAEKRIIIPGQVVREFAKNRQEKLAELYQQLVRKRQFPAIKQEKYPLLGSLKEFSDVINRGEEVNQKIGAYQDAVDRVLAIVKGWHWNDPVSLLYHEIFTEDTILDIPVDEEATKKELNRRQQHDIPPGYKDSSKKDEGVGDFLIWRTILEIGKSNQKDIIFVSGETKADWYKKSEGQALYPRYELVDEFRRASGGHSFHMVNFSRFLELYGATEKVVEEVRKEEDASLVKKVYLTGISFDWGEFIRISEEMAVLLEKTTHRDSPGYDRKIMIDIIDEYLTTVTKFLRRTRSENMELFAGALRNIQSIGFNLLRFMDLEMRGPETINHMLKLKDAIERLIYLLEEERYNTIRPS